MSKFDYSAKINYAALDTLNIDLDSLGLTTIKVKYKNTVYRINIDKFLNEFGNIEAIIYDNKTED